jgi:hypothetical protein
MMDYQCSRCGESAVHLVESPAGGVQGFCSSCAGVAVNARPFRDHIDFVLAKAGRFETPPPQYAG